MTKVELLAPAGSPEALDAAIAEGADSVYLGLKEFNARMRSANFTYSQFEAALRAIHRMGRKLYVTVNTVFEQREADRLYQFLKYLAALGPDGILVQDFGIIEMVRDNFPSLKLHASTQMNIASARGVNLLSRHGFSRVVLSRELSLDELREIRANTNMELEVFIHGALCISISGICLFSSYLGGKSANRGMCTQACRRLYTPQKGKAFDDMEGEGGYYFSPADLELIEQVPALAKAGVNAFKIEGRMKSAEYVGTVVSAYRLVIDSLDAGEERLMAAISQAKDILKNDFARPKTSYLIGGIKHDAEDSGLSWLNPKQDGGTGIPLGKLLRIRSKTGRGEDCTGLLPAGVFAPSVGDSIRLHRSDDSDRVSHKIHSVEKGFDGGHWVSIPDGFNPGDMVYLIQTKVMTKRYTSVIKGTPSGRIPGREKAPLPKMDWVKKGGKLNQKLSQTDAKPRREKGKSGSQDLPAGIYVMVSRIEDLYVLQSSRPVKIILPMSQNLVKRLCREQTLPFPARDVIFFLDPFFPQGKTERLEEELPVLMEKGYTRFIVNNLGHFSLFKQKPMTALIAGPWLYTLNAWAYNFISRCGAEYNVSPLENNRQNLEKTFPETDFSQRELRSRVFITVFARPSLFRIRKNLAALYGFENFKDSRGESFRLTPAAGSLESDSFGSLVYPQEPFSIIDKIPFLREAGFSRFILDFSDRPLKKIDYRDIMEALNRGLPLPGVSRFNWKDGFFRAPV